MPKTKEKYRIPVKAFTGGYGYRYVAGPPAQFPFNDFTKPDEASWIVFEIATGGSWGGDSMGIKIEELLDKFLNDEPKGSINNKAQEKHCDHDPLYKITVKGKWAFTIRPNERYRRKKVNFNALANVVAFGVSGRVIILCKACNESRKVAE